MILEAIDRNDQNLSGIAEFGDQLGMSQFDNQFNVDALKEGDELYRQAFQKLKDIKTQLAEKKEMLDKIQDEIVSQNY